MLNNLRFLLVEDDTSFALVLKGFLSVSNQIELAATINEAQKSIETKKFDVFLLDKGLPDGDGLTLIPGIRKNNPHSPVVILTGDADYQHVARAIELGADDYLVKSEHVLTDLIFRILLAISNIKRRFFYSLPENISELTPSHFENFLNHAEKKYISKSLVLCHGDVIKTSKKLGVSRATLFNKVRQLNIIRPTNKTTSSSVGDS
ncbi:MAG: response regulator [Deltaproteobacteria bacterium]|nr:response regulator [Deltaproteobacteria bacterium]